MTEIVPPPFAGEYPTEDEARRALEQVGFGDEADTIVTIPMDSSRGPLATELTRCKSAHLTTQWPVMFRAIVGQMVRQSKEK